MTSPDSESRNPALEFLEFIEVQLRAERAQRVEIPKPVTPLEASADFLNQVTASLPSDPYQGSWGQVLKWQDEQQRKAQFIREQPEPLKTFYEIEKRQDEEILTLTLRGKFNLPEEMRMGWQNVLVMVRCPERPSGYQLAVPSYVSTQDKVKHGLDLGRTVAFGLGSDFQYDTNASFLTDESAVLTRYFRKLLAPDERLKLARFR